MSEEAAVAAPVEAPVDAPETSDAAPTLEASDSGVTESEGTTTETLGENPPDPNDVMGDAAEPVEAAPAPLWSEAEWSDWNGSRDTLDDRYHTIYDRMTEQHGQERDRLESMVKMRDESIRALMLGEDDPQIGHMQGQLAERDEMLAQANQRVEEARKALEDLRSEYQQEIQTKASAEVDRFEKRHSWIFENGVPQEVKDSVSHLIEIGVTPTAAGDYLRDKPKGYQEHFAKLVLGGTHPELAAQTAEALLNKARPEPLPEPLPGGEFVNGSGAAPNPERAPKKKFNNGSVRETRNAIAESMFTLS
jgi:hypothetical protein